MKFLDRHGDHVRCEHGFVCEYVFRTQHVPGYGDVVVGGDYWHTPDEKCESEGR